MIKLSDYRGKKSICEILGNLVWPLPASMPELVVRDSDRDFEILTIMAPGLPGEKQKKNSLNGLINKITSPYRSCTIEQFCIYCRCQVRSIPTEVFRQSFVDMSNWGYFKRRC